MNTREAVRRGNALFLLILCAYVVVNQGIYMLSGTFHISFSYVQLLLIAQLGYAAPAIWYAFKKPQPVTKTIRLRKMNPLTVPLLILFAFTIMPLMNFISMLSLLVGKNHIQSTVSGILTQTNLVVCLVVIGILPAMLEEFVYRGVIYNEQRKGNVGKAMLCSGLFFGLLHMNINQFSYAFAIGIVLALTVEATGSILGPMIVHATINGNSVLLSWWQSKMAAGSENVAAGGLSRGEIISMLPSYVGVVAAGTVFAVIVLIWIVKINKREDEFKQIFVRKERNQEEEKVRFADGYFILAVSLSAIFMIARELA